MPVADHLRRGAGDDGVGRHVASDHGARGDDRPGPDLDPFHHHRAVSDPDVVADFRVAQRRLVAQRGAGVLEGVAAHPVAGMGVFFLADEAVRADRAETPDGRHQGQVGAAAHIAVGADLQPRRDDAQVAEFDLLLEHQRGALADTGRAAGQLAAAAADPAFPPMILQVTHEYPMTADERPRLPARRPRATPVRRPTGAPWRACSGP